MKLENNLGRSTFWIQRKGLLLDSMELFYQSTDASGTANPLYLNMTLGGSVIGVRGDATGEGLQCLDEELAAVLLEGRDEIFPVNASRINHLSPLLGGRLQEVFLLYDESIGDELGMLIVFSTGFLFILNLGDEIFVLRNLPTSIGSVVKQPLL